MADWLSSMGQTFEYYIVDPGTWTDTKLLTTVKSCTITRDSGLETLGSASFEITESVGECYIRVYLVTTQSGVREKHPLGTFLVQTPSSNFDGRIRNVSMDAYTPLLELKEKLPPIGYFVPKGSNVADFTYMLTREHARAPVVKPRCITTLSDPVAADINETWLSFLSRLIANTKSAYTNRDSEPEYKFDLDEMGRILFSPKQDMLSLQPVWTYNDDNSSILQPAMSMAHDLYGIPNVIEVVYSTNNDFLYSKIVNDDPDSPTSTIARGREIAYRVTDPDIIGDPRQKQLDEYAEQYLRDISSVEYTITYTHGYCPVRVGDCVRFNYSRAGLSDIKAKVISQTIKCEPGCPVTETAIYTNKLWR